VFVGFMAYQFWQHKKKQNQATTTALSSDKTDTIYHSDSDFDGRSSMRSNRGNRNPLDGQFTRAPAQKVSSTDVTGKTFADVAGNEEAVARLKRVQGWLEDSMLYDAFGGKFPKGVLLVGPPGTGKTLLVQALAGEAKSTLFAISGSDFVEMFVGVGAGRVRDLFQQARDEHAETGKPVIIFIDEIDAVGKKRGSGGPVSNDEREGTLNQLLVEMQGFAENKGIIVIAATNRADTLDAALRRPGRFDYTVFVDLPDLAARTAIFKVHMRNKPTKESVDAKLLAKMCPGFSGADIELACNEAATLHAESLKPEVAKIKAQFPLKEVPVLGDRYSQQDLDRAKAAAKHNAEQQAKARAEIAKFAAANPITLEMYSEGIATAQMGEARKSRARVIPEVQRKQTSYHEAGHAAVMHALKGDPVTIVTIMPRANALGYTQATPDDDRLNMTDAELLTRIKMAMGGRAAQEIFMNTVDTGAANDFKQASMFARKMVTEFGMSELGPIHIGDEDLQGFGGSNFFGSELINEANREWRRILKQAKCEAEKIIKDNRDRIERIVARLLEVETIHGPEFVALWNGTDPKGPDAGSNGSAVTAASPAVTPSTTAPVADPAPAAPADQGSAAAGTTTDGATTNGTDTGSAKEGK
jgi:cell division protease FtsH